MHCHLLKLFYSKFFKIVIGVLFIILTVLFFVYKKSSVFYSIKSMINTLKIDEINTTSLIFAPKYSMPYKKPLSFEAFSYDEYWMNDDTLPRALNESEHKKIMDLIEQKSRFPLVSNPRL